MSWFEQKYKHLIKDVIDQGTLEKNRTGVNCYTLFNYPIDFDLSNGYMPVITGKKIFYDKAYHEWKWIYNGWTTISYLNEHDIHWWDEFADKHGYLGKTYGYQLRSFNGRFDQVNYVVKELKNKSRRAHITFWNPTDLNQTSLPCCYTGMTFTITDNGKTVNASLTFRSSDIFLGLPYDFIFGALMLIHVAKEADLNVGTIGYLLVNAHIYENHIPQCLEYLKTKIYDLPKYKPGSELDYESGPLIKAKLNN